jgi:hypothetical protein
VPLNVALTAPSSPWINLADCATPSDIKLAIAWGLTTTPRWFGEQGADVFLALTSTCEDPNIEIGDPRSTDGTGSDIFISTNQTTGIYPPETSELTFQDILDTYTPSTKTCPNDFELDTYFCIRWQYETTEYLTTTKYIYRGGTKIRFDTKPPAAPVLAAPTPGESNLKLKWTAPADTDLAGYIIYHSVSGADSWSTNTLTDAGATSYQLTGLENNVTYDVKVAAIDQAQNEGNTSTPVVTGTPIVINDFFETYKNAGGKEDGGFCFVATAAYGSYHDSMVAPLRRFRDATLSHSQLGRDLITGYYQYGPRWARAIRDSAFYRTVARGVLLPAVAVAEAINYLGLGLLLLIAGAALIAAYGVRWSRRLRILKSGPAIGASLLFFIVAAPPSIAQAAEPHFQIQIRFGPYYPAVDSEKGLSGHPFRDIFGSRNRWLFEIDGDYEIWRGFGAITIGGSFGFIQYVGRGLTTAGVPSSDTAILNLFPLRLTAGYHFDMLARWWNVPLVPYVGAGISYYFWWSTNGVGHVSSWSDTTGNSFKASGGIFGYHVLGGIKFLLDWLDPSAAMSLENEIGIKNTYLFVEYQASFIDNFGNGSSMNLSGNNIMFGMMMEF